MADRLKLLPESSEGTSHDGATEPSPNELPMFASVTDC